MAYALSFADSFFWGDGSVAPEELRPSDRPTSVYQAILSLSDDEWAALARELFGVQPDFLDIETVLDRVLSSNTCRNLDSPVEVYIDPDGDFTLLVY